MEDATAATLNNLTLVVGLMTAVLAVPPLAYQAFRLLRRKHSAEELRVLRDVATVAVQAVEQMSKTKPGKERLDQAIALASVQLRAYGIKVEPDQLRAAIEAAVLLANVSLQLPAAPATTEPTDPVQP